MLGPDLVNEILIVFRGSSCPRSPTRIIEMSKSADIRVFSALLAVCPFALLRADMHARKQRRADEGDLVNDQQKQSTSCQVSSNFRKAAPSSSIIHAALAPTPLYAVSPTFAGTFLQGRGCHKVEAPLIENSSATPHIHTRTYINKH